jgi:hypothetical protein
LEFVAQSVALGALASLTALISFGFCTSALSLIFMRQSRDIALGLGPGTA